MSIPTTKQYICTQKQTRETANECAVAVSVTLVVCVCMAVCCSLKACCFIIYLFIYFRRVCLCMFLRENKKCVSCKNQIVVCDLAITGSCCSAL